MKKTLIALITALTAPSATATELWNGEGKLFNRQRDLLAEYTLEVRVDDVSPSEATVEVTVRDQSGAIVQFDHCQMHKKDNGWTKDCDGGTSRGKMFAFGLGVDYYEAKDGKAYATNIVIDSGTQMRLFRTELVNGQAQRFFAETLTKARK